MNKKKKNQKTNCRPKKTCITKSAAEDTSNEAIISGSSNGQVREENVRVLHADESNLCRKNKLHPLFDIEHVLHQILSYLDLEDMKSASQVCTAWLPTVQKLMVKETRLSLTSLQCKEFLNEHSWDHVFDDNRGGVDRSIRNIMFGCGGGGGASISLMLDMHHYYFSQNPEEDDDDEAKEGRTDRDRKGTLSWILAEELLKYLAKKNVAVVDLRFRACPIDLEKAWTVLCFLAAQLERVDIDIQCDDASFHFNYPLYKYHQDSGVVGSLPLPSAEVGKGDINEEQQETATVFRKLNFFLKRCRVNSVLTPITQATLSRVFRKIISQSPLIQTVKYKWSCEELFDILKTDNNNEKKNSIKLKNLKCINAGTINQEEFQILSEASPSIELKCLSFKLHSGFRVPPMYEFLSKQGSLEKLSIDFVNLPNIPESFSCAENLVNLKHLTLKKFYGSIHFVSLMPLLESLTLIDMNLSVALHDEASTQRYKSNLKCIKTFGVKGSAGRFLFPDFYSQIVSFFPELEKLRMEYFTDFTLGIILNGLPNLKELEIPNGIYTDAAIISSASVSSTDGESQEFRRQSMEEEWEKKAPSLSDLKHLSKLVLQSPRITDVGVRDGLMKCPQLKSLSIDCPLISNASLQLLSCNPELLDLEFVNCYQLTPDAVAEAKELWGKGRRLVVTNR